MKANSSQELALMLGIIGAVASFKLIASFYPKRIEQPLSVSQVEQPASTYEIEHFELTPEGIPICPHCSRSDAVFEYAYGLAYALSCSNKPVPEGKIPADCLIHEKSARYRCGNCGTRFGRFLMRSSSKQ
jgi:hypothetical protein